MTLSLIVAIAENGVIGNDNKLPWHIPEDLRYFKRITLGKPVIMGRKTYESIGRPLPQRPNIVVTRDSHWAAPGVIAVHSIEAALHEADRIAGGGEAMVIGGAALFEACLPLAQRLYLTEIHRRYDGDIHFPDWQKSAWRETERKSLEGDPSVSFVVLERL